MGGFRSHGGTPIPGWDILENPREMDEVGGTSRKWRHPYQ